MSLTTCNPTRLRIAYARVSTEQQSSDLESQIADLLVHAEQKGMPFVELHEDIGSAHKRNAFASLLGLQAALKRAAELGSGLVVRDPSRLSRNLKEFRDHIAPTLVPIHSLKHGRVLSVAELEEEIAKAEKDAKSTSSGTKRVLGAKKKSSCGSAEMRRRASIDVQNRQLRVTEDVIVAKRIVRENPTITARQLGEALLQNGRRPPRGDRFTILTARERLRAAQEEITLEDEEDDIGADLWTDDANDTSEEMLGRLKSDEDDLDGYLASLRQRRAQIEVPALPDFSSMADEGLDDDGHRGVLRTRPAVEAQHRDHASGASPAEARRPRYSDVAEGTERKVRRRGEALPWAPPAERPPCVEHLLAGRPPEPKERPPPGHRSPNRHGFRGPLSIAMTRNAMMMQRDFCKTWRTSWPSAPLRTANSRVLWISGSWS
ncbi:recombinase family protein [Rhodobacter sp. KR11]|uniref:recombinase family protein n=1 Tax=Rhodobacter sp. KR11 TaxID=2974588 RepID=UPI0022218142|nr:recombinase family protein [Rhodobacter sp. KR11]MCW1918042.1 recombinase family protein [Rhodobacter sp. KR11]